MDKKRMEDICRNGEATEKLLQSGRAREAATAFEKISTELESAGDFDSYIAAKITLAQLRAYIKVGDFKQAYDVWNASLEDSLHGIGIYALESAQTTVEDMLAYDLICAYLHTLADSEPAAAAAAVTQYLSRVCEQATEEGNRGLMKLTISNWKQHLREIFGATIPAEFAKPLIGFEKAVGETVKPIPLEFPQGSSWEKPRDFLEMSRFTSLKKVKRPRKQSAS